MSSFSTIPIVLPILALRPPRQGFRITLARWIIIYQCICVVSAMLIEIRKLQALLVLSFRAGLTGRPNSHVHVQCRLIGPLNADRQ